MPDLYELQLCNIDFLEEKKFYFSRSLKLINHKLVFGANIILEKTKKLIK